LFFVSVVIASVTFILSGSCLSAHEGRKNLRQDSTTFAIAVMVLLFIAFIAVTTTVLFL
jgi:hypothetical protein